MLRVLLVVLGLGAAWLLLRLGRRRQPPTQAAAPPQTAPDPMVACTHCGLWIPATEALPGPHGVYCCEAHRKANA